MWGSRRRALCLLGALVSGLLSASWTGSAFTTAAASVRTAQTVQTASYRVKLEIGPAVKPEGMGATSGMPAMEEGKAVNHHLGVSIQNKSSGTAVMNVLPAVTITDEKAGTSRRLETLRCVPPNDHGAGPHFGNNLYLPDGKYTVTITVGNETAVFRGVVVKATGSGM